MMSSDLGGAARKWYRWDRSGQPGCQPRENRINKAAKAGPVYARKREWQARESGIVHLCLLPTTSLAWPTRA